MLSPHLRKFNELYQNYGLGAVKNIWLLVSLLPLGRTVNLYKLKDYVGGVLDRPSSQPQSHYKRLIRFFQDWGACEELRHDLMRMNLRLLKKLGANTLILDGTSWTIGEAKVHYLVLSVLVDTVAVPIYWTQLEKIGASSQEERKAMFDRALKIFDLKGMTLLADREYIGQKWFKYLKDNGIAFVIRLRFGDYFEQVDQAGGKDYRAMLHKCRCKGKLVKKQVNMAGYAFTVVMLPNPKAGAEEPILIFLTSLPQVSKAARMYAMRWKIECLFKHLKSNGYNLEDLNLKDPGKNQLMMALAALAYVLAIRQGWPYRKHIATQVYQDGSQTPEVSIFREGLARLIHKCFRFCRFLDFILGILNPKNHAICKNVQ